MQRTAAARMFVRDAELLVADDLSSALDVETERTLWQRIDEMGEATCLVVSQRRGVLQRADQIVVLKVGRVEAKAEPELALGPVAYPIEPGSMSNVSRGEHVIPRERHLLATWCSGRQTRTPQDCSASVLEQIG